MSYAEKLKDPQWQRRRLLTFRRDQWKCRCCSDAGSPLHAHHLYYVRGKEPWDYPRRSIITLCETCHKLAHSGKALTLMPNPRSPREMGTSNQRRA